MYRAFVFQLNAAKKKYICSFGGPFCFVQFPFGYVLWYNHEVAIIMTERKQPLIYVLELYRSIKFIPIDCFTGWSIPSHAIGRFIAILIMCA